MLPVASTLGGEMAVSGQHLMTVTGQILLTAHNCGHAEARGGGLELPLDSCWLVMASPEPSNEPGIRGEISGRSCRPVPGGYGAFVITV